MRSIPVELLTKLGQHLKAASNGAKQNLKIIATQITSNTLLSEPIHEDIQMNYGDVALRQIIGESDISKAYAICIDQGIANIYQRLFPANLDHPWVFLWSLGEASDVGIEFQGTWELNAMQEWYYLQTEEYPYLFWIDKETLYVQKWNDTATRVTLDIGVSQLSVCKGWKSNQFPELDQGLIVGYLKEGKVYYRAYCSQADGTFLWEPSYEVAELGVGNNYLSVIRTNDFRIGFLTEKSGTLYWTLSRRNYAGMSFRPERVSIQAGSPKLIIEKVRSFETKMKEQTTISINPIYFVLEPKDYQTIQVVSIVKLNCEDSFKSYGYKLYVNRPVRGIVEEELKNLVRISISSIASVTYLNEDQAFLILTTSPISRALSVNITFMECRTMYYESYCGQKYPFPTFYAVTTAETNEVFQTFSEAVVITGGSVSIGYVPVHSSYGWMPNESLSISGAACSITLVPVSNIPI